MFTKVKNPKCYIEDFSGFERRISGARTQLINSNFYLSLLDSVTVSLPSLRFKKIRRLLCYGLGNFLASYQARYQLALLLLLRDEYNVPVEIYDPKFEEREIEFLQQFDLTVLTQNEKGCHFIDRPTLVFLPHVPHALFNNLLYRNWSGGLVNVIVLGNSLNSERLPDTDESTYYLREARSIVHEISLEYPLDLSDVFNDIALHVFPKSELHEVSSCFWQRRHLPYLKDL